MFSLRVNDCVSAEAADQLNQCKDGAVHAFATDSDNTPLLLWKDDADAPAWKGLLRTPLGWDIAEISPMVEMPEDLQTDPLMEAIKKVFHYLIPYLTPLLEHRGEVGYQYDLGLETTTQLVNFYCPNVNLMLSTGRNEHLTTLVGTESFESLPEAYYAYEKILNQLRVAKLAMNSVIIATSFDVYLNRPVYRLSGSVCRLVDFNEGVNLEQVKRMCGVAYEKPHTKNELIERLILNRREAKDLSAWIAGEHKTQGDPDVLLAEAVDLRFLDADWWVSEDGMISMLEADDEEPEEFSEPEDDMVLAQLGDYVFFQVHDVLDIPMTYIMRLSNLDKRFNHDDHYQRLIAQGENDFNLSELSVIF